MKGLIFPILIFILFSTTLAQDKPFQTFREAVKREQGGFSGDKRKLSDIFNNERIRLGEHFEADLWEYLGNDPDKYYWIAFFVDSKSYLHGNTPVPKLAFRIRKKGVELLKSRKDARSLGQRVTMERFLAISAKQSGDPETAIQYKNDAESTLASQDLRAYVSSLGSYQQCIYKNLEGDITGCRDEATPGEKIISAGFIQGRALSLPSPIYPAKLTGKKIKAQVDVRILIDTDGSVISAETLRGPKEFYKASIDAALRAKFPPTFLSGQAVKVSGWLTYDFNP
ncbi:MAG TPA: energy transducer TonB [Pyrinomonadaceae bacterium]|jgi:hypothetical protein|nr:energy transducer TonB [Pyrinomonadaceae bacterium]